MQGVNLPFEDRMDILLGDSTFAWAVAAYGMANVPSVSRVVDRMDILQEYHTVFKGKKKQREDANRGANGFNNKLFINSRLCAPWTHSMSRRNRNADVAEYYADVAPLGPV
eukprot:360011-Pyramimonas_sp.AAC.1